MPLLKPCDDASIEVIESEFFKKVFVVQPWMIASSLFKVQAGFPADGKRVRQRIFAFDGWLSQDRDYLPTRLSQVQACPGNNISGNLP